MGVAVKVATPPTFIVIIAGVTWTEEGVGFTVTKAEPDALPAT
jgi:hypothetical protein